MDADDVAEPSRIARLVASLKEDLDVGLIGSAVTLIDEAGNTQRDQVEWNRLGYGNNAIQEVAFRITRSVPMPTGHSRPPALPTLGARPRAPGSA